MEVYFARAVPTDNQEGRPHTVNVDGVDRAELWIGVDDPDPVCRAKRYADGHCALRCYCGRRWALGFKEMIWHGEWNDGDPPA